MTLEDILKEIIKSVALNRNLILNFEQIKYWPEGAIQIFESSDWIKEIAFSSTIECPGCEQNCYMPVHVLTSQNKKSQPYVACNVSSEIGLVKISPLQLRQWQITDEQVAAWITHRIGINNNSEWNKTHDVLRLGHLQGKAHFDFLEIEFGESIMLKTSLHSIPLINVLKFKNGLLNIDKTAIINLIDLNSSQQKVLSESRIKTARHAANVRHNMPGGSREKQEQIRKIWASGKYSSRDLCAEQECAALQMSPSTARKALRNTPNPVKS